MMEISVTFLLAGCLIQGVLCGFSISLPERVEALEGSCVFIPCIFEIDQTYNAYLTDTVKRLWYKEGISKDSNVVVFDSSISGSGHLKGEIFGKPTEKRCSIRFDNVSVSDNGSYYFRLEGNGELKYSYTKLPNHHPQVEIVVRASPPNPTVLLFQDQQEVMEVTEGKSVTLSCFKIFCPSLPSSLTWSFSPEHLINANITEQQHQNQTHYYSDLMFTVTQHHHRAEFTCTSTQQQITTHSTRQLHVQYAPKSVSAHVSPAGVIVEGHSVTLSCSSEANPAVKYSWYRHTEGDLKQLQTEPNLTEPNLAISNTNLTEINLTGPNLTISNINRSHSGRYYCRAENQHGSQNTSVLLDVQYPPEKPHIHTNSVAVEGHSVTLSCSSEANPAVNYSWYRHTEGDLKPVQTEPNLTINTTNLTEANLIINNTSLTEANLTLSYYDVTGPNLTIKNINRSHSGRYYCKAQNQHGVQNTSMLLDVQYAPKSVSAHVSPAGVIVEGHSVTLSCSSEANPAANHSWYRHIEGDLEPLQTRPNLTLRNTNLTGPNLTISNINRSHSGRYYCRAENQHGTQNTSVLLDVHFPPKISSFCSRNNTLRCVCKVEGNPLPKLQWRLSGKVLNSTNEMKISEQTVGKMSLESILTIRQSLSDSSVLQCWTANAHGSASHQFQHITTLPDTGLHTGCVLLGFAIGASLILIFCVLTVCNQRKKYRKLAESTRDDTSGLILTQSAVTSNGQCVCADKRLLLPTSETLHYSSIDFTNTEPPSGEIRGLSTLTEEYATVRLHPANAHTPDSTNTPEKNTPSEDTHTAEKNTPEEEVIYENMKLH
ncbi:sialic acid-binding Ig-like lectin 10 isoform X1 [Danio rerio]|uniref:Sialic acid-binding Ig-like lectin 10 isoform X1 n=2 Tax=Danio rerio TaxID=7955 RepID=A0AC58J8Y3_DANRE